MRQAHVSQLRWKGMLRRLPVWADCFTSAPVVNEKCAECAERNQKMRFLEFAEPRHVYCVQLLSVADKEAYGQKNGCKLVLVRPNRAGAA